MHEARGDRLHRALHARVVTATTQRWSRLFV